MRTLACKQCLMLMAIVALSTECVARKSPYSSWREKDSAKPLPPIETYDQRQTGKYNINVNIKDVAIISIDPESLSTNVGVS